MRCSRLTVFFKFSSKSITLYALCPFAFNRLLMNLGVSGLFWPGEKNKKTADWVDSL
jgi:hypothetical protein